MNITSSYQVRIVNCSVNLNETVCIYRKALAYLIGVVNENWNAVKRIDTGNLEQQRYIDKLVHSTKNHEAKYPDFDKCSISIRRICVVQPLRSLLVR